MAKVIDRYTPEGKKLMAALKELAKYRVKVGYQRGKAIHPPAKNADGSTSGKAVDMVDIAAFNELGTEHSPSRPFLRRSVDDNLPKLKKMAAAQKRRILKGDSVKSILNDIGLYQKRLVQQKIVTGPFTPNAPSTKRRKERKGKGKGEPIPLVDEGTMRKTVMYVVEKR